MQLCIALPCVASGEKGFAHGIIILDATGNNSSYEISEEEFLESRRRINEAMREFAIKAKAEENEAIKSAANFFLTD